MRWTVALMATLLVAGCSSKDNDPPSTDIGIAATDLDAANVTQTVFPLVFAGGTREGEIAISETFAAGDACFIGFPDCIGAAADRTIDLTPIIPAEVPVELSLQFTADANIDVSWSMSDAQFIQISDDDDNGGGGGGGGGSTSHIDALLVRGPAGTISVTFTYQFPDPSSAQGFTLVGTAHTVTRAEVVPAFLPVAIQLGPGDTVNATADGLSHLVAFPPSGEPVRAVQFPFGFTVPEGAPSGTWILLGEADEAMRLTGPNRTIAAQLLQFVETTPVDVAPNAETTFTMDVPGHPLHAGVFFASKPNAAGFGGGVAALGNHQVSLVSPQNVDVLDGAAATCSPAFCDFSILRGIEGGYTTGFLNEHLTAGTYQAKVAMETANDVQAFAFALYVGA